MTDELRNLIRKYETDGDFTHPTVSQELLTTAETKLQLLLPDQYKDFLLEFGHGGIGGIETLGIGCHGELVFLNETLNQREYGLATHYVVIENCDEWLYCLDCNNGNVVSWQQNETADIAYQNFDDYLSDRLSDAIENM